MRPLWIEDICMSSADHRQSSATDGLHLSDPVIQLSPVEQLPFPDYAPFTASSVTRPLEESATSSTVTSSFPVYLLSPAATRTLPELNTGSLPATLSTTTALRTPVVIHGGSKKSIGIIRPPKGRPGVVLISAIAVITLLMLGTSVAVVPVGGEAGHGFNVFQPVVNMIQSRSGNPSLIAQQAAATATAVVHQDGYDPSGQNQSTTGTGLTGTGSTTQPVLDSGNGGLNRFAFGQCTYWANMRYHALTGYWVPWLGNAYQWAYGAAASGWIVSSTPHVPSIIVLQPYVQGAGGYGHVAIVESINSDGSVNTSNYNWYANGGWDILSYVTFHPGPGVVFVWHP
jgi:surface antigen